MLLQSMLKFSLYTSIYIWIVTTTMYDYYIGLPNLPQRTSFRRWNAQVMAPPKVNDVKR